MVHATIRDVAREADVSVASVSRVLNGHSNVRPAVRERVQAVAAALGYVPHAGARNLSLARTNAIGVMLPDLHGEFFSETARGIDSEASVRGLQLLLSNAHANPARAIETLRTMRGRVDGVIIMAPDLDPEQLFEHLPPSLPAVLINCRGNVQGRAELRVDNVAGAEAMVDHLVSTGRRRIVHLSGPEGNSEAQARVAGYRAAMARHGLAPRIVPGDFFEEAGAAATDYLRLLGLVAMGYCFARSVKIARARIAEGSDDDAFYRAKIATATFFFDRILPQATACFLAIKSGKQSMMALDEAAF